MNNEWGGERMSEEELAMVVVEKWKGRAAERLDLWLLKRNQGRRSKTRS
jgi:hypothetical protein